MEYTLPQEFDATPYGDTPGWMEALKQSCGLLPEVHWILPCGEIVRVVGVSGHTTGPLNKYVDRYRIAKATGYKPDEIPYDIDAAGKWLKRKGSKCPVYMTVSMDPWGLRLEFQGNDGKWGKDPVAGFTSPERYYTKDYNCSLHHWVKLEAVPYHGQAARTIYLRLKDGEDLMDASGAGLMSLPSGEVDPGSALATRNNLDNLQAQADQASTTALVAEAGMRLFQRDFSIERARMEALVHDMQAAAAKLMAPMKEAMALMKEQVEKMRKVITLIGLYLGEDETVVEVKEGRKAPNNAPIHIFQRLLYADEEVGDPRKLGGSCEHGINHENASTEFPKWLLGKSTDPWYEFNYQRLVPVQKGVVAVKISRQYRNYTADGWDNAIANDRDRRTFLVIRNGTCVWMVDSEHNYGPRLFPANGEMEKLYDRIAAGTWQSEKEAAQKAIDELHAGYATKAVVLQGIVDRCGIFELPPHVKMLNPETHEGHITFIRDDEGGLGDGSESWNELRNRVNPGIRRGSRVVLTAASRSSDRFDERFSDKNRLPSAPQTGLYSVEEDMEEVTIYPDRQEGYSPYDGCKTKEEALGVLGKAVDSVTVKVEKFLQNNVKGSLVSRTGYVKETPYRSGTMVDGEIVYEVLTKWEVGCKAKVANPRTFILYNPGDEVGYGGWGKEYNPHTRTSRIRYYIHRGDSGLLAYDDLTLEEVEGLIRNRAERIHYLSMMPLLWEVRDGKLAELAKEKEFIRHVILEGMLPANATNMERIKLEALANRCVKWWKEKVIFTRALTKDTNKAVRMIRAEVKRRAVEEGMGYLK